NYCDDGCLTAYDGLLRKMIYDLRSNDIFAFRQTLRKGVALTHYNSSRFAASSIIWLWQIISHLRSKYIVSAIGGYIAFFRRKNISLQ
ncbi:MAG: hypothetical protein IJZ35_01615, partial [Clostridia bacterium]|nr:hypothetical protein [Clostridia bacterium]